MRRFKTTATAGRFCRGHALIRTLSRGFPASGPDAPPRLGLASAWTVLATTL